MTVQQISIFVENKSGTLLRVLELFKEAYILEEYYEMMYRQGARISKIPEDIKDKVLNTSEMNRIENEALPAILKKIESLLTL